MNYNLFHQNLRNFNDVFKVINKSIHRDEKDKKVCKYACKPFVRINKIGIHLRYGRRVSHKTKFLAGFSGIITVCLESVNILMHVEKGYYFYTV